MRGWDVEQKQAVSRDGDAEHAGSRCRGVDPVAMAGTFGGAAVCWRPTPAYAHAGRGRRPREGAGRRSSAAPAPSWTGVAKGNPKLRAGAAVTLAERRRAVRRQVHADQHPAPVRRPRPATRPRSPCRGRQERSLYGLARRAAPGRSSGHAAWCPAIVSDVQDPQKLGRVRVTFPWLSKDFTSGWARTVQRRRRQGPRPVVLPEVGDEVLVGFEHGDFDAPYVLGGLYNGKDTPPKLAADRSTTPRRDRRPGGVTARAPAGAGRRRRVARLHGDASASS